MRFEDWVELNERAKSCGIGNDRSLDQLLHIIQFKEVVKSGHRRTMRELHAWEKNIAKTVEQRIEEAEAKR